MSAMVERVARAICEAERMNPDDALGGWIHWTDAARAAILAMREPTSVMLKASCGAMSETKRPTPDRVSSREKHRIRYRAMIDAELSKQTFAEATALTNGERDG